MADHADQVTAQLTVTQLLAALPDHTRRAVQLRYLADQSEPQTAQLLGIPLGTVKSRIHYALARMRAASGGDR